MKLLWLSHFIPFPPRGGNAQRSFNLIRQMSSSHDITLVALNFFDEPRAKLVSYKQALERYCKHVEIWDLAYRWRGGRWWAEMVLSPLFGVPFSCRALFSQRNYRRWEKILRQSPEALVHFDSIDLALFATAMNGYRKVLNHHNCESAMAYRRAQRESNWFKRVYLRLQADKLARLETSICCKFDVNLAVSDQDAQLLHTNALTAHFHTVENGVDTRYFTPAGVPEQPLSLIFTGSLDWHPNFSGICFWVREVWPRIKSSFPDARLRIAGKNPPQEITRWPETDSTISVVANPVDVRPLIAQSAVYICPILEGGGTRLKILDAMAMGKPVVSTTIGCEGLGVTHGENILLADDPGNLAHQISRLLSSEQLRRQLGNSARALVEQHYDWEKIGGQLQKAYICALHPEAREEREQQEQQTAKRELF
jgi:glycosyltransferase involved in cell wall biosynthesis